MKLDIPSAVGIGAVLAALAAYFIVGLVANLATTQVATLLSVFLVGGVLGAILSATASDWFLHNFSTLGISTRSPRARSTPPSCSPDCSS